VRTLLLDLSVPLERGRRGTGREAAVALAKDPKVWVSAAVALVIGIGVPTMLKARLGRAEGELGSAREAYRKEAAAVAADSARVAALQADSARLAGTLGTLARLEGQRYAWPRLMDAAAAALPRYAWMTALELDPAEHGAPARFRVRAVAPAQDDVSRYERALAGSPGASRVALEASESLQAGPFALVGFTLAGEFGFPVPEDRSQPKAAGYHPGERLPPAPTSRP
jgi:Tfp pilus assembly protein PilN